MFQVISSAVAGDLLDDTQISKLGSVSVSPSAACEWRYPQDHRNTIISTHWHHSALHNSNATPLHGSRTPPPASCSTVIVFIGLPHCLCGGPVDNVANLCPNRDPTLPLWPVFFPLNQTRWCSCVMRGGGGRGGGPSVLPGTGVENVKRVQIINLWCWYSHWWPRAGMWTAYVRDTMQGHHHGLSADSEYDTVEVPASLWLGCFSASSTKSGYFYHLRWEQLRAAWANEHFQLDQFSSRLDYFHVKLRLFDRMDTTRPNNWRIFSANHWYALTEAVWWDADGWRATRHSSNTTWVTVLAEVEVKLVLSWLQGCILIFHPNSAQSHKVSCFGQAELRPLPCLRCRLSTRSATPSVTPQVSTWTPPWCSGVSWKIKWSCGGSDSHAAPCCATVPRWPSYWDWASVAWASSPPPPACPGSGASGWAPHSAFWPWPSCSSSFSALPSRTWTACAAVVGSTSWRAAGGLTRHSS